MSTYNSDVLIQALRDNSSIYFLKKILIESYCDFYKGYEEKVTTMIEKSVDILVRSQHLSKDRGTLTNAVLNVQGSIFNTRDGMWFRDLYKSYKTLKRPHEDYKRTSSYISGRTVLDVGAGACYYSYELQKNGYEVLACDVLDYRNGTRKSVRFNKMSNPTDLSFASSRFDTSILKTVCHHISPESVNLLLTKLSNISNRLILEEDVYGFSPSDAIKYKLDQSQFNEYCVLSEESQKNFLVLMDFFGNIIVYGINDMNMPYSFHKIDEWIKIIEVNGWNIKNVVVAGFDQTRIHRPCQAWFICESNQ